LPTRRSAWLSHRADPLARRSSRGRLAPLEPRFQEQALQQNLQLADWVTELAEQQGITPAQPALAWLMAKGEDIVPIPKTKSPRRLEQNAAAADMDLSRQDVEELDDAISRDAVRGVRYPEQMMALLTTDQPPCWERRCQPPTLRAREPRTGTARLRPDHSPTTGSCSRWRPIASGSCFPTCPSNRLHERVRRLASQIAACISHLAAIS
jgi:Aldo/keto reductase family